MSTAPKPAPPTSPRRSRRSHPAAPRAGGALARPGVPKGPNSWLLLVLLLAAFSWVLSARVVRSLSMSIKEREYVQAARFMGLSAPKTIVRHILPNTVAPLIVQGTFLAAAAILVEAALSFLGIGIPPEIPSWGNIMAEGRTLFRVCPHNIFYPGISLAFTVLAINIMGDGLRDTLDPKMSKKV